MKITIEKLFNGTDIILPPDIDKQKEVTLTEKADEADGESILLLTKRANGQPREITLSALPYAVVCERDDACRLEGARVLITENARRTLAIAYSNFYGIDYSRIKIIAVTGTNGKTTVAEMLHHILRETGADVGYIGTGQIKINETVISDKYYSMTTPDPSLLYRSIKEMEQFGCAYAVMEASSHGIALSKLTPIKFEIGIFTNLSEEHRDFHTDMQDYFKTKLSLFESCRRGIFNLDCPYSARAYELARCERMSVGIVHRGDTYATDIYSRGLIGTSFYYREEGLIFGVDLALAGAFNVYNALMALKCAIALGIKPCEAKRGMNTLSGVEGRMERLGEEVSVVIDYAHTPFAVENALKSLYSSKRARQRLSVVIGCGGERERDKRREVGRIARKYCDKIYLTEDNSRTERTEDIITEILTGIKERDGVRVILSRAEAIRTAILTAERGEIIAILGKGRESYMVTAGGYTEFSDKHEAQLALRERESNANNS